MTSLFVVFSIIAVLFSDLSDAQTLELQSTDPVQVLNIGSGPVFTCGITSLPPNTDPDLKWIDNNNKVVPIKASESDRIYIRKPDSSTIKLYIGGIQQGDSGTYTCQATINTVLQTKDVEVSIFKSIYVKSGDEEQTPVIYTDAVIECVLDGIPVPVIRWEKDTVELTGGGRYLQQNNGLMIRNISEADNGVYVCIGEVTNSFFSYSITVTVTIPPKITLPFAFTGQKAGTRVIVTCVASGKPKPTYEWMRKEEMRPLGDGVNYIVDKNKGTLTFASLKASDDGMYVCRASNVGGGAEQEGMIDVKEPPKIVKYQDTDAEEDNQATMNCEADGDPAPAITFQKEGRSSTYTHGQQADDDNIVVNVDPRISQKKTYATLTFTRARPDDAGNYICRAENEAGINSMTKALRVKFRPNFSHQETSRMYSWGGMTRPMICVADGEPKPIINWYRQKEQLADNSTYTIQREPGSSQQAISHLMVKVDFTTVGYVFGEYSCRALNERGEATYNITLNQAYAPGPPSSVTIEEDFSDSVRIAVTPPVSNGGIPVTSYKVEYGDSNVFIFNVDRSKFNQNAPAAKTYVNIDSLNPNAQYTFSVYAGNEVGYSGTSKDVTHTTLANRRPYEVVIDSPFYGQSFDRYELYWKAPRTGGLALMDYTIRYRAVSLQNNNTELKNPEGEWKTETTGPSTTRLMLTGLRPNTSYQVEVIAQNLKGSSDGRKKFFKTKDEATSLAPSSSTTDPTNNGIQSTPPFIDGRGEIVPGKQLEVNGMSTGAVIGIVFIIFLILLVIVDVTCYYKNNCGILNCICKSLCGKKDDGSKDKLADMEAGESKETAPLTEGDPKAEEATEVITENPTEPVDDEKKDLLSKDNQDADDLKKDEMEEKELEDKPEIIDEIPEVKEVDPDPIDEKKETSPVIA